MLNEKSKWNELSQYFFNREVVKDYIYGIKGGFTPELLYILIEVYLGGNDTPILQGNNFWRGYICDGNVR